MLNRRVLSAVGADRVLRVYGLGRGIPSMTVGVLLEMPRPTRNPDSHGGDMAIRRRHEMAPDLDSACRAASSRSSNSANVARVSAPSLGAGFGAAPGVAESFTGGPVMRVAPALGNISRAVDCGSFTTSS